MIDYCSTALFPVNEAIEWLTNGAPDVEKRLDVETGYANDTYARHLIAGLQRVGGFRIHLY